MAIGSQKVNIVISATDKFSKGFRSAGREAKGLTGIIGKLKPALLGLGVAAAGAAVAFGVKAVKGAVEFEKAMSNVSTLIDTNVESMEEMSRAVKEIAERTPVELSDLTAALFQVRSAGIEAADAMGVLETSAKLGVTGLGTTEESVDLLTSAINTFKKEGMDANEMANILFKTTKFGKTVISELAQTFGQVAPITAEMGVSFIELQAATAALTTTGQSASIAQSQIRAAMVALLKPTKTMSELFEEIGVSSGKQLIETSGGLVNALAKVKEATGNNEEIMAKAIGRVEGLNAALFLLSEGGGAKYTEIMDDMLSGTDALTEGFEKQTSTVSAQFQILKNKLNVAMIDVGITILPGLIRAMEHANTAAGNWNANLAVVAGWLLDIKGFALDAKEALFAFGDRASLFGETLKNIPGVLGEKVGGVFKDAGNRIGGTLGFQDGGVVPGPIGAPVQAVVHGGETIIPTGQGGKVGNVFNFDFSGAVVGDENSLIARIINAINRQTELVALGGT